ncbi:MAG: 3D domain-containing protein [Syntrophomonadaceae bacterium]|nr:3D domain-containing protein [Syntrophomonadaceae bacterium]
MTSRKIIIPVFIMAILLGNLFIPQNSTTDSSPQSPVMASNADSAQFQQQLNNKGFWIGALDGLLSSKAYQEVMQYEADTNLVADGFVGLRTRQSSSLAAVDSTSASALIAETPDQVESAVNDPAASADQAPAASKNEPVKVAEKPAAAVSRGSSGSTSARTGKVITMVATGYDGCYECNKPYYGYPSYIGLPLERGIVAVDPKVIPMGTRLYVEGYGEAIAADQGNAIKGNRIDLYFDTHQEALKWGMKTVKVTILDQ